MCDTVIVCDSYMWYKLTPNPKSENMKINENKWK